MCTSYQNLWYTTVTLQFVVASHALSAEYTLTLVDQVVSYHCKHSSLPIYIHTERTNADSSYTRTAHEETEWPLKGSWTPCPHLGFVFPSSVLHSAPKDSPDTTDAASPKGESFSAPSLTSASKTVHFVPARNPNALILHAPAFFASRSSLISLCQPIVFRGMLTPAFSCG